MSKLVFANAWFGVLAVVVACGSEEKKPAPPTQLRVAALTVDLWLEGAETAPPALLPVNDLTHRFEYVNGSNSTASTAFTGRVTGLSGASGIVRTGAWSASMRGTGQHPNTSIPVFTGELRKRIDTSGHSNVRLTYWRRLVGFEGSILNGVVGNDRFVVRYSTAAEPGPSDWTSAEVVTNGAGGAWTEGVVENLPAASTLWISFQADLRPRLNTSVSPSVYQFDEWIYLDDFVLTGDTGCAGDAECDDADACTTDTCDVATGLCANAPVECGDGLFCNGVESCNPATGCVAGVAPVIDDGSACTNDSCDEANDVVAHAAIECNDALFCNGVETCDAVTGCVAGTAPILDDGISCTTDSCDETTQAVLHTPYDGFCFDDNPCTADSCNGATDCTFTILPGAPCGYRATCDAAGACLPDPPRECDELAEHDPCGEGASWCENGECVLSAACGDGWLNKSGVNEPIEECDDGNNLDGDACSPSCESVVLPAVGDDARPIAYEVGHALGANDHGQMLMVWQTNTNTLVGRRMTTTGQVVIDEAPFLIDPGPGPEALLSTRPQVVGLASGDFAVVYAELRSNPSSVRFVYRVVGRDGGVGEPVLVSDAGGLSISDLRAVRMRDKLLVAWSEALGSSPGSLRARIYRDRHPATQIDIDVATLAPGRVASEIALAAGDDDRFAIAWTAGSFPNTTVSLRTFEQTNSSTIGAGPTRLIGTSIGLPALAALPVTTSTSRYALAWQGASTTDGYAYAAELDRDGVMVGPARRVTTETGFNIEFTPTITALGDDAFAVSVLLYPAGGGLVRVLQRDSVDPGAAVDDADFEDALEALSMYGSIATTGIDRGVWFAWTTQDPGNPLPAYLLAAPDFALEDTPTCFNTVERLPHEPAAPGLATLTIDAAGDRVLVKEPDFLSNPAGVTQIFVYRRHDGAWSLETTLLPVEPTDGWSSFGEYFDIYGDTIVVSGAADGVDDSGVVYVYEQANGSWTRTSIPNPTPASNSFTGNLALSREWLIVATVTRTSPTIAGADVYRRDPSSPSGWRLVQNIALANPFPPDFAIDGDSMVIAGLSSTDAYTLQGETWVRSSLPSFAPFGPKKVWLRANRVLLHTTASYAELLALTLTPYGELVTSHYFDASSFDTDFGRFSALNEHIAIIDHGYQPQLFSFADDGSWTFEGIFAAPALRQFSGRTTDFDTGDGFVVAGLQEFSHAAEEAVIFTCEPYDACGDGWLEAGEACDDGNDIPRDGCENDCTESYDCHPMASFDFSCNGIDDDCDQVFDEDYGSSPTTCGTGVCASSGALTCEDSELVNSCVPGAPNAPTDTSCNASDDDCDGDADEDFVAGTTSCGVGACTSSGALTCSAGNTNDSCTPLAPLGADTTCDLVDDDCDAQIDESYAPSSTSCGLGVCAAGGQLSCSAGDELDTCTPLPPNSANDASCNDLDDDCDGDIDEDCACTQATATVSEHVTASRAFACSTTPVTFFADGFESGTLSNWTATGNATASTALAHAGSYSAQIAGIGTSTLRRTLSTAGLSTATLSFQVRTRGPSGGGYYPLIRHSINGGSSWTQLATHPGPLPAWSGLTFNTLPINSNLTLSFEASPTETTRFVHFDSIAVTGTCTTPTWFAQGSNASLGTSSGATTTLYNLDGEPGVWRSGSCPVLP